MPGSATLLALVFLFSTVHRNRDWRDNESIFRATLAENPDTLRVHTNLATTYDYLTGNLPGRAATMKPCWRSTNRIRATCTRFAPKKCPSCYRWRKVPFFRGDRVTTRMPGAFLFPSGPGESARLQEPGCGSLSGRGRMLPGRNYNQAVPLIQKALTIDPELSRQGREILHGKPLPASRL